MCGDATASRGGQDGERRSVGRVPLTALVKGQDGIAAGYARGHTAGGSRWGINVNGLAVVQASFRCQHLCPLSVDQGSY